MSLTKGRCTAFAIFLIAVFGMEMALSVRQLSQTFDESAHILAGYQYWHERDFAANPEHPPLVKLVATLPLFLLPLKAPALPPANSKRGTYLRAKQLIYENDADAILLRTRLAASTFALLLAAVVFLCGYEMFGPWAALLSLILLVFEPNILANGPLVTTDIAASCFIFAAVYTFYRYAKQPNTWRLAVCGLATGLAFAAKHSTVLLLPILVGLAIVEVVAAKRDRWVAGSRLTAALVAVFAIGIVELWAFYTFRFDARPHGEALVPTFNAFAHTLHSPLQTAVILWLARHHALPQSWLWGLIDVLVVTGGRAAFLLGKIYPIGQWFYFPAAFAIKSTISLLTLLLIAPLLSMWRGGRFRREAIFLLLPPAIYMAFSMTQGLNLGVRHILPVYPFLIVLAGAAAASMASHSRPALYSVAALLLFHAGSSAHSFPNYLTYSNELAGGPANTWRLLDGSNADWEQGFKQLATYIKDRKISDCWFAYSEPQTWLDPGYYIPCRLLPSGLVTTSGAAPQVIAPPALDGVIIIKTAEVTGRAWGPGELNPYRQFLDRRTDDEIANTILVFRGHFETPLLSGLSHAAAATRQLADGDLPGALEQARVAVRLAPESAATNASLCGVLLRIEKAQAEPVCRTALSIAKRVEPEFQLPRIVAATSGQ